MQQVVSRNVDPLESAVLSLCQFNTGNARNVIPQTAEIRGTVRTLKRDVANMVEKRMHEICKGVAQMTGADVKLKFEHFYPVTMNHPAQTEVATKVAREIVGDANVYEMPPMMGGEDFSYMLQARPGAFIFCGNGDSAELHHPAYNFSDEAIVHGSSYWIKLVENTLAA
jgi:hippurate hydrolase